jgi:hypothetical protein
MIKMPQKLVLDFHLSPNMKAGFKIGDFELVWLNGGRFELDGGAMFGVVPKVLWQKKYPANSENYIPRRKHRSC